MELRLEKHVEACGALAACEAPSRKIIGKIIGRCG